MISFKLKRQYKHLENKSELIKISVFLIQYRLIQQKMLQLVYHLSKRGAQSGAPLSLSILEGIVQLNFTGPAPHRKNDQVIMISY